MTLQIVVVDDQAPGETTNSGLTEDGGRTTITSTKALVGTSMDLSGTLAAGTTTITGNLTTSNDSFLDGNLVVNTGTFTVEGLTGNTVVGGNIAVAGGISLAGSIVVGDPQMFTVNSVTGDTSIGGDLVVGGTITNDGDFAIDNLLAGGTITNAGDLSAADGKLFVDESLNITTLYTRLNLIDQLYHTGEIASFGDGVAVVDKVNQNMQVNDEFNVMGEANFNDTTRFFAPTGFHDIVNCREAVNMGAAANGATSGIVAIPLNKKYQSYSTSGTGDAMYGTINEGISGQELIIQITDYEHQLILYVASGQGFEQLRLEGAGEYVHFIFVNQEWQIISTTGFVVPL